MFGQQSIEKQKLEKLVAAFELVIEDYAADSLYKENVTQWDKQQLASIFQPNIEQIGRPELKKFIQLNKRQLRNDLGFDLSAGFLNNFEKTLLDSEGRFFRRRYTVGTRWEILNGGLLDNRLKASLLDYDIARQKELDELETTRLSIEVVYQRILFVFNRAKVLEIEKYLQKLDQELLLLRSLSDLGYDVRELFRDLARKQFRYEMQLEDFKRFELELDSSAFVADESLWQTQPALFELIIDSVKNQAVNNQYVPIDNLVEIETNKNIDTYKRWRDVSANLQLQYNYFDRLEEQTNNQFLNDREFFSLSGTVRIPLTIFSNNYNKTARLTTSRYKEALEQNVQNHDNELIGQYREFENRKRGIFQIDTEIDVVSERIADEKSQFEVNDQNYNPALLLNHISNRQSLVIERLIAVEDFYLTYYKIWRYAPKQTLSKFTRIKPNGKNAENKTTNKGTYLWSKELYGLSNSYLVQKIREYELNAVALSVGQLSTANRTKVMALIAELQSLNVEVALLVGNNAIVNDTLFTKVTDWVKIAAGLNLSKLHLDIEPHALDNWRSDRKRLEKNYLSLLDFAAREAKLYNLTLVVSIPHFYDEILEEIDIRTDFIYVMVYQDLNIPSLTSKLKEEKRILKNQEWGVSLRASDFSSKEHLALFIKGVNNTLENKTIYLHDFKDLDTLHD
jgi:hypothetical protein